MNISGAVSKEKKVSTNKENKCKEKFASGMCFSKIIWIFLICCVVGFLVETLWCFIKNGYIESRKSLVYGPFSVAYGIGGVVLTLVLYKLRSSKIWKIFLVAFVAGTVTEYICSLGQEIVFGSVAWDYSDMPLNINGRVCLLYSLFWGLLGVVWIKLLYPAMSNIIEKIPKILGNILTWVFIVFFVFDCFMSATAGLRMDQRAVGVEAKNSFESYLDNHFDDEKMHEIYANSTDV